MTTDCQTTGGGGTLPSWNDTPTREAIVAFVERVTTEGGADYVPPPDRVAVFDNDGTLCESQQETRDRIVNATMELHEEVGPARTTIAEIARRAGVQRLTVYNHFPDDADLIGACQNHWLRLHPPPDPAPAFAEPQPERRVAAALELFYRWYRETEPMTEKVQRDRGVVAPLDSLLAGGADAAFSQLADELAAGFSAQGGDPGAENKAGRRALIRVALDFWTWRRLDREGLSDAEAAAVMASAIS